MALSLILGRRSTILVALVSVAVAIIFGVTSRGLFGVRYDYTLRIVTAGSALLGSISGLLGSFAVLRKQSLLGDALSHAALPGIAIAFLLAGRQLEYLLLGAAVASALGVGFIKLVTRFTRVKADAAMGIVLTGWFAAGLLGLTYIQGRPDASQAGLDSFIFGQAASIGAGDVRLLLGVSLVSLGVLILFWKQFKLVTFDPDFAASSGYRIDLWNGVLSSLVVLAIVMGLQIAGVVLMVGLLIAPGVAARQWTSRLEEMVLLATLFGALSGGCGAVLSAVDSDLPTGPMIILVVSLIVAVSVGFAPGRGVVSTMLRRRRERRRFALRTGLRDVYHYAYDHGGIDTPVPEEFLFGLRGGIGRRALRRLLAERLLERREVAEGEACWTLTAAGTELARRDARNQHLWDLYREAGHRLGLTVVPEDRSRDIRALLSADEAALLEELSEAAGEEPRVRD